MNTESQERHYCLETLYSARNILVTAAEQLPKLRAGYDKDPNSDKGLDYLVRLQKNVKKVHDEMTQIIHALDESDYSTDLLPTAQKLNAVIRKFKWLDSDYENLCKALGIFAQSLPQESNINTAKLGRLMNRVKMGYFPTDLPHVKQIKDAVLFPTSVKVNILDPCCGCGLALQHFTDGENAATYGVELDRFRAEKAEKVLDRVGYGTFFRSRLSHRAFHCVFLNPPYMSVLQQGGGSQRAERSFLLDILCYLTIGGLLVYIIPYYRMTEDICRILAENFNDLQVYKFQEYEFKKYKQVVIFGRLKERDVNASQTANALLYLSLQPERIPEITQLQSGVFSLPDKELKVKIFKGAEFNVNELAHQLNNSNSINHIFDTSKLDTMHRNPLLPLKIGQIGLIGGSGLMNGLVECENPHIIKGRVIKQVSTEVTTDSKRGLEEVREVTSNRMVFKVLTPFGCKTLT